MTITLGANRLLHVFGNEVVGCEAVISRAFSELLELAGSSSPAAHPIHNAIRIILSESALVSLVFFPSKASGENAEKRAEFLRGEFEVGADSLLKNTVLRNHLAHLDERLDKWAMNSASKTYGRQMIGSREDAHRIGLANEDVLGIFDPRSFTYAFLDDDLEIDDLVGEVRAVSHKVRQRLRNLPWTEEIQ